MFSEKPSDEPSIGSSTWTGSERRLARRVMWVVLILALAPSMLVRASHIDLADADDTAGSMDVRTVQTLGSARRPAWRVVTFSKWKIRDIWDRGQILVFLDTFGDGGADYYALVYSAGAQMNASLWRTRDGRRDRRLKELTVWRKDDRSVSVIVSLKELRFEDARPYYRWRVETLWRSNACPRVCFDFIPDDGFMREVLVTTSPSPSLTPTNVPVPTLPPLPTPVQVAVDAKNVT